ncbi:MAG TPA: transglycosylase SLT domain-containing protein [Kofleriaceae bacterium]|nr:transglycosylase SLT domain-containing protein [Kofleriaceae bacterium]
MARLTILLVGVLASACGSCGGDRGAKQTSLPTGGSGTASVPTVPPGTPAPLSETMAVPYFQTGDAAEGAKAFALEKFRDAQVAFAKARTTAKADEAARLDLMLGLTHARLGEYPKAAEYLLAAEPQLPLLSDYIHYHAARALYFAHQMDKALAQAQAVARDSIVGADAELLVGDLLRTKPDHPKILAHYRDYLARHPNGPRKSEVRFRIAEELEATAGDVKEIVDLYRKVQIEDPLSSWTPKAKDKLVALTPKLPAELQKWDQLTAAEHITRGKELFDAMRNPESEAAFDAALKDPAITVADKCIAAYHKAQSRFKARDRKGAAPMFDEAAPLCHDAKNVDLEIKCLYQAGRSYAFTGQHDIATQRYQTAQTIDPKHSYADDAMLREAEEWASRNDAKQVEAVLSALPAKFPTGDNLAEAMWRLGFRAWKDKKYDDAIKWWTKQIELVPHDDNYFGEGQAQYWLGRAYAVKGDKAKAIESWQKAVREYPAAFYALLSLNRMRETDAKAYEAMVAEISTDPKDFDPKAPAFTFKPRVEWGMPGFARALEMMKLGLGQGAEQELTKLGLAAPSDKKRVDDPDKIEKLWAMAFLFDRAGRYQISHWPTRWHILDYRKQWPIGGNRARWQIAYPLAYQELLARHAKLNNVPFAMQIAIVREESAFDPLLESYANAIGLTQMIPPTAKDFSKGTGIDPTRENLRDPEKNVTIGSRFLGHLFGAFNSFVALVPPGYNAGPAAVRRMLKLRGTMDTDEFLESIVDDQARNYSKRVLGTFFTYSWLYDKQIPEIPNTIPKDLIPK